jgi:tRNA uridine 5-carboxymethylaminomethyl modification enzyme
LGCVGSRRAEAFAAKQAALAEADQRLANLSLTPSQARARGLDVNLDGVARSARDLLRYPGMGVARLAAIWPELGSVRPDVREQVEIDALYAGYLDRQEADIRAFRKDESLKLDPAFEYDAVPGLSVEVRQRLARARPATLGQAARIEGVTPAALTALLLVARGHRRHSA